MAATIYSIDICCILNTIYCVLYTPGRSGGGQVTVPHLACTDAVTVVVHSFIPVIVIVGREGGGGFSRAGGVEDVYTT